ncbi:MULTISPECIES: histidine kinase [unclassified Streptomyces]|uniref:sensor histidine kinase n=1 Tax=unclassified Streptomyces TaxID=2593676 RepID=UPI000DB9A0EF|nr:histidine kinase [Streptomyces sp. PsTaAH-137]MYT74158.1 sensor histidine kinase [Streptomyces sp. SID8367]RAJ89576.1 signal transduction histidine kinase [Streptomyces sp. PsTaAH-137]
MNPGLWTTWPTREALSRVGRTRSRRWLSWAVRIALVGTLLWTAVAQRDVGPWAVAAAPVGLIACAAATWGFYWTTLAHRLWPSLGLLALLLLAAMAAHRIGFLGPSTLLWCGCAVYALQRMPLLAAIPATGASLAGFAVVNRDPWLTTAAIMAGLCLSGYVVRLDAEARGSAQRLLVQERAARAAEAESAALAERARIAREIHDVLAHSLSAQLVHLEAARLLIERGADREQILDRVVAARGMARDGLTETRQALSALRGEMTPLEEFLEGLVAAEDGVTLVVEGERPKLPAESSQAVRRVAQEALTNVRKHAPGAKAAMRLTYEAREVALEVRDSGASRPSEELTVSGAGYGLLGMRERAELLGGTLEAGPYGEGFVVTLRVPL